MNSLLSIVTRGQASRLLSVGKSIKLSNIYHGNFRVCSFSQQANKNQDVYYSKKHEYVIMESDSLARVGISNYAQEKLGDVVYVQLPEVDRIIELNEDVAAVESVKAASEVYSPVSGTVTDVNKSLETDFALINKSPLEKGWIFKVSLSDKDELKLLMDQAAYDKYLKNEADEEDDHH
ncbi:hypothetical protein BOX15_Mlig022236g1 [Macrostomum lignano]|uniref:Uncharacterized protein n=2 Tax=Macrostomum lignano TaxID=282301 RepID=A0A267EE76_9PLAT|nr:hypothetical protein BOX15_Mlig022236g3 [Macrostomum lignano]PAA59870.1 hypothetical protein BOX15_Mlig022236g2 [Macrostomum lignano]PAA67072.1 hypothetical protein BOX15_Mlig022236g1 [Macrostomum lignano]